MTKVQSIVFIDQAGTYGSDRTGGKYTYSHTEYRDWWSGKLIATSYECSSDFSYCPQGLHSFSHCRCNHPASELDIRCRVYADEVGL